MLQTDTHGLSTYDVMTMMFTVVKNYFSSLNKLAVAVVSTTVNATAMQIEEYVNLWQATPES